MTIFEDWQPRLTDHAGPRYRAIVDALESDLRDGRLEPGTRLPTHRDLADRLGLTVGTVTRAYAEARRRGLTRGEVGRGTFVRGGPGDPDFTIRPAAEDGPLDLALSVPPRERRPDAVADALRSLAGDPALAEWLGYQPHAGHPRHRAAAVAWLAAVGVASAPDDLVLTAGVQNAIGLALEHLTEPGDVVLTESLTYPGVRWIAAARRLQLEGVAMDAEGLRPDALDEACRRTRARVVYLTPSLQNPTVAIMSEARREEIARVARERSLRIVEDDVYRPMLGDPPRALADFAPERSFYAASFSKGVAPALRLGLLRTPPGEAPSVAAGVRTQAWMVSPLLAELATRLVESGEARSLLRWKREEAAHREATARAVLAPWSPRTHPDSYHCWVPLPAPLRGRDVAAAALARGARISPSDTFAVDEAGAAPEGIRISLLGATDRAGLRRGLDAVAAALTEVADGGPSVI